MSVNNMLDVIIVGGSYAGLSAALSLGRAIQTVVIVDSGEPCNRQTPHSHNFLGHDGDKPAAISTAALAQILKYPTVHYVKDKVSKVLGSDNRFVIKTAAGSTFEARKVLFATGVRDIMPDISGFAQCWGISAIHCPYCHGYEFREKPTGLLMNGDGGAEHAIFLSNWTSKLTLFTNGPATISPEKTEHLRKQNIPVIETPVRKVVHRNGQLSLVEFSDGNVQPLEALYARLPFEQHCAIPEILGCTMTDDGFIRVDGVNKTSLPGVFAAGDNTTPMRSVSGAVAAGTMAGAAISRELITQKLN